MTKPTLCIYHGNCVDGFTAAWVVWKNYGDAVQFHPGVYGQEPPDVHGHDVLIVDFSYKRDVMERMAREANSITVLDHHKTAEAELQPLLESGIIKGRFDGRFSGAMLTWVFVMGAEFAPRLLEHVQDRDLWKFKIPGSREIHAYISAHEFSFRQWNELDIILDNPESEDRAIDLGRLLMRKQEKEIRELLPIVTRTMTIGGLVVPVANLPFNYASEAGNIMAGAAPFAACYCDSKSARMFSLRSRSEGGADVSVIAARYGGGGHRNAAGFEMPIGWEGEGTYHDQ